MSAPSDLAEYVAKAATEYAAEFIIPIDEVREWYRASDDKPGLVDYMIRMVQIEKDFRQKCADDRRARIAAERAAQITGAPV